MADYADPTVTAVLQNEKVKPGAVLVLLAGIISLAFCGFFLLQKQTVENQTTLINRTIAQDKTQRVALESVVSDLNKYNMTSQNLHAVFDNQIRYEKVLAIVEKRLYKKMKVTSFQINDQKGLDISGVTNDYTDYAKIYTSFTDQTASTYFSSVKPISVSKTDKKADDKTGASSVVNFSFHLILTPQAIQSTP